MKEEPHYWTFWKIDLPGFGNLEGLGARKTKMSSSVKKNNLALTQVCVMGGVTCILEALQFYSGSVQAGSFVLRHPPEKACCPCRRTTSPQTQGTAARPKAKRALKSDLIKIQTEPENRVQKTNRKKRTTNFVLAIVGPKVGTFTF
ncbi:MAG: hypothetical protein IPK21_20655 [Haliscomenobacter sp.]|nr:hypothetical protein [Haliscomenobacter sp.]